MISNSVGSKGFTIIELLMVMAIVIIFPTVVVSNFSRLERQFTLSRVAYSFAQELRSTQNKALAWVQYKDKNGKVLPVSGYGLYVDVAVLGNKKYVVYADYPSPILGGQGNQVYDPLDYVVSRIDLDAVESGVIIKSVKNTVSSDISVNFNIANSKAKISTLQEGKQSVEFVFALAQDETVTKTVAVNSAGLIEVK